MLLLSRASEEECMNVARFFFFSVVGAPFPNLLPRGDYIARFRVQGIRASNLPVSGRTYGNHREESRRSRFFRVQAG